MEFRHLGRSGMLVSEISYGNWITHGSQVEEDAAIACVQAALDLGITTFDTADVYAGTRAEDVLGRALQGQRREGLEIFTKVYWPTGAGPQRPRPVPQAHHGVDQRLAAAAADRLRRPVPGPPLRLRDAARRDDAGLRRRRPLRQGPLHRRLRVDAPTQIRAGAHARARTEDPVRLEPAAVLDALAGHRGRGGPACEELGIGQIVWSPIAQGVLTGKYLPGQPPPAGSRATDDKSGAGFIRRLMSDDVLTARAEARPLAEQAGLTMAQLAVAWVLQNPNVSSAIVGATRPEQVQDNVKAAGVKLDADLLKAIDEVLDPVVERDPAKTDSRPGPTAVMQGRCPC